ncbi:MAG: M12 family metallo-peptidase [Actinomycetota bacterium]
MRRILVAACALLAFVLIVPKSPVSADAEPRVEKALSAPAVNATGSVPAKTIAIFAKFTLSTGAVISLKVASSSTKYCKVSGKTLKGLRVGPCKVTVTVKPKTGKSQSKTVALLVMKTKIVAKVKAANEITFRSSTSFLFATKLYPLSGTATSGLPLAFESLTPDTCSVSEVTLTLIQIGSCTVQASQGESNFYQPATAAKISITISDTYVTSDQIDAVTGFQVKAIYVVPSDGVDHSYDTNGYIAGILDEGNRYLREQLGLQIPIDKHSAGYDIQYLPSKFTTAQIQASESRIEDLLAESMALEDPGLNRKDYIFFVDVDGFSGGTYCGWAGIPGIAAVVAIGDGKTRCTVASRNFNNWAAQSWVHELIHNFGVEHTLDTSCDLMKGKETAGTCPTKTNITIDRERSRYIGSSTQGQNILSLRVWEGYTDRLDLEAICSLDPIPRADGFNFAYCPTGTQTIGPLKSCWSLITSVTLQEFKDGQWTSLGSGSGSSNPWGSKIVWKCNNSSYAAPSMQLTVTTPGTSLYRWLVNGTESEQFKVIWVR